MFRQPVLAFFYLFVKLRSILILKGQISADHGKENDSSRPHIGEQTIIPITSNHFWRGIAGRPTGSLQRFSFLIGIREPKIDNFKGPVEVKQQVFRFEIPMNNVELVNILDSCNQLLEQPTGLRFLESTLTAELYFLRYTM